MKRLLPLGLLLVSTVSASAADRPLREELGRNRKLRILVDKVLQKHKGWVTEEWMIRESAEAGFNVYSPRRGHDDLDAVRAVTRWCREQKICHMPWMRGTLRAPADAAEVDRLVWADGLVSRLYSPNSDHLWRWMTEHIVAYAKVAAHDPTLMGVFLDYENYEPTRKGNCYDLSYDLAILRRFAKARGMDLPDLAPTDRRPWLDKQGLHQAFEAFQVDHWRRRCRALRKEVDAHDPGFRFCVYPSPGTKLMTQAIWPEWATERAPLILADHSTYGRPALMPLGEALAYNRNKLIERRRKAIEAGINFIYAGGIDPVVTGADPEFCGKNAVTLSHTTDGYWIFYEGPTYTKDDHGAYWKWFSWANEAIAAGRWEARHEPRETPRQWNFRLGQKIRRTPSVEPVTPGAVLKDPPRVKLRNENALIVCGKAGEPIEVDLALHRVARYPQMIAWEAFDDRHEFVAAGDRQTEGPVNIRFTPKRDGVYMILVAPGRAACSVARSNAPVGLHAGYRLSVIRGAKRLYFHVPDERRRFEITARGAGRETVRLTVFDPTGKPVASAQSTPEQFGATVKFEAGEHRGATWSLSLTKADSGVLEDGDITLGSGLPPVLSLTAETVFK